MSLSWHFTQLFGSALCATMHMLSACDRWWWCTADPMCMNAMWLVILAVSCLIVLHAQHTTAAPSITVMYAVPIQAANGCVPFAVVSVS